MKNNYIICVLLLILLSISSCEKENNQVSTPVIKSVNITSSEIVQIPDSITFSASVEDLITPLSTLEVDILVNGESVVHKSIRTKGNTCELPEVKIGLPFLPNISEGKATLLFTLINIDGLETTAEKEITIERPVLPDELYLKVDESVIILTKDADNPMLYKSEEGEYNSVFSGLVSTSEDLENAEYIWGQGKEANNTLIGNQFSTPANISFPTWLVSRLTFNVLTFAFGVEGTEVNININGTDLQGIGSYFYSKVNFVKGGEFAITGIDAAKIKSAYNRDFFSYDEASGKLVFTGETGTWDVYYSLKYNYFWVSKMADVAPATYWIVGHGFSCTPQWYSDFSSIGWDLADVKQLAYMKPLGSNKYQATIYLTDQHDWGSFDIQIYSNRTWDAQYGVYTSSSSFTGDSAGIEPAGDVSGDIVGGSGFVAGYYRLTLDVSNGLSNTLVDFKKLN